MELMSSVLLCALVAFLPQVLGVTRRKFSFDNDDFSDSYVIRRKMNSMGKNIMLNKNPPNLLNRVSDLQSIFMDPTCRGCYTCMERAMKAHKSHKHMMDPRISSENFQDDRNMIEGSRRDKRNSKSEHTSGNKTKRSKSKRNRGITLTKYKDNGKIYALKIKETNLALDLYNKTETVTTCQVYSVQKTFSCDSSEAHLILTDSKKMANRKRKKGHGKRETKEVKHTTVVAPVYSKRNIDDSQVQEQIMPSIEEMY